MYYQTFNTKNVDYSSAIAVLIVVLGIVTAKVVNTIFKEKIIRRIHHEQRKKYRWKCVIYIVLGFWALTTIYPIFWVIINSFKAKGEILSNSFALPTGAMFTLANYRTAFERLSIFSAYRNSMIISTSVAAIVIVLAGMASFGLVATSSSFANRLIHWWWPV